LEIEKLEKKVSILEKIACSALEISVIIEFIKVPLFIGISGFVVISIIPKKAGLFYNL
jgi:hypothetical protein